MLRKPKKYSVAAVRAALTAADLFFPKKSAAAKQRRVRKFLRRIRVGSEEAVKAKYGSEASVGVDIFLRTLFIATEKQVKRKSTVLREFAHFFRVTKNDRLAANALTGYLFTLPRRIPRYGVDFDAWLKDAEEMARLNPRDGLFPIPEHDTKAALGHAKTSLARIGKVLGFIAAKKERSWKKPASGLFFIREVSNGVPAKEAIKKIESGQLDAEIRAFAKKHFANLFANK